MPQVPGQAGAVDQGQTVEAGSQSPLQGGQVGGLTLPGEQNAEDILPRLLRQGGQDGGERVGRPGEFLLSFILFLIF